MRRRRLRQLRHRAHLMRRRVCHRGRDGVCYRADRASFQSQCPSFYSSATGRLSVAWSVYFTKVKVSVYVCVYRLRARVCVLYGMRENLLNRSG